MKINRVYFVLLFVFLLGCKEKASKDIPVEYDSMLQIEVGSGETVEAINFNDGNVDIAATCYIPVPSKGGPGHVLSYCDGLMVELTWDKVEPFENAGKPGVAFKGFRWRIANFLRENESTSGKSDWGLPHTEYFNTEFKTLVSSVPLKRFSNSKEPSAFSMIRARWLPKMIDVPEIQLKNSFE